MSDLPKSVRKHLAKLGSKGGKAKTEKKRKAGAANLEKARAELAEMRRWKKASDLAFKRK